MEKLLPDCHVHTCFSGDSEAPVKAMLDKVSQTILITTIRMIRSCFSLM